MANPSQAVPLPPNPRHHIPPLQANPGVVVTTGGPHVTFQAPQASAAAAPPNPAPLHGSYLASAPPNGPQQPAAPMVCLSPDNNYVQLIPQPPPVYQTVLSVSFTVTDPNATQPEHYRPGADRPMGPEILDALGRSFKPSLKALYNFWIQIGGRSRWQEAISPSQLDPLLRNIPLRFVVLTTQALNSGDPRDRNAVRCDRNEMDAFVSVVLSRLPDLRTVQFLRCDILPTRATNRESMPANPFPRLQMIRVLEGKWKFDNLLRTLEWLRAGRMGATRKLFLSPSDAARALMKLDFPLQYRRNVVFCTPSMVPRRGARALYHWWKTTYGGRSHFRAYIDDSEVPDLLANCDVNFAVHCSQPNCPFQPADLVDNVVVADEADWRAFSESILARLPHPCEHISCRCTGLGPQLSTWRWGA